MPSTFFSPLTLLYEGTQLCKHQNTGRAKEREKINKLKKKKKKTEYMEYMLGCGGEGMVGREVESKTGRWGPGRWRVRQDDEVPGGGVGSAIDKDSETRTFNIKFANSQPNGLNPAMKKLGVLKFGELSIKPQISSLKKSSHAGFTFHSNNGPELWSSRPF